MSVAVYCIFPSAPEIPTVADNKGSSVLLSDTVPERTWAAMLRGNTNANIIYIKFLITSLFFYPVVSKYRILS